MQGSAQAVLQTDVCAKVIHFCDWRRRAYLASLNRTALGLFAAHDAHWAWMCRLLSEESRTRLRTKNPRLSCWRAPIKMTRFRHASWQSLEDSRVRF